MNPGKRAPWRSSNRVSLISAFLASSKSAAARVFRKSMYSGLEKTAILVSRPRSLLDDVLHTSIVWNLGVLRSALRRFFRASHTFGITTPFLPKDSRTSQKWPKLEKHLAFRSSPTKNFPKVCFIRSATGSSASAVSPSPGMSGRLSSTWQHQ